MVFADRAVFGHGVSMADQHAAGLAMLIACPLTYVGASIVIVAKWLNAMAHPAPPAPA
jgi:putative membrane protein